VLGMLCDVEALADLGVHHLYVYMCVCVGVCECVHVHVHVYVYTYICAHTSRTTRSQSAVSEASAAP
jgi:hypothetical protein